MKIRIFIINTIVFLYLPFCTSYETSFDWNFRWNLYNSSDSTLITGTTKYLIRADITDYVLFSSTNNGIIDDWYSGQGITNADFINSNSTLYFTLIYSQTIFIDTFFLWEDLNLHPDSTYVSHKSFYINL